MAVRFYSEFKDDKGENWRVEIHDEDFTGTASEYTSGASGFELTYNGDTEKPLQPIVGSSVMVPMIIPSESFADFEQFEDDLLTANEDRFSVVIYDDFTGGNLYWVGILQPEQIDISDESKPRKIEITAADDLANLKGVEYTDDGTPYEGLEMFVIHLIRILNKTRTTQHWGANDLFLSTQKYFTPALTAVANTYEVTGFVYEDIYINKNGDIEYPNCYDILYQICETLQCTIYQARGRWFLLPRMYLNTSNFYNVNEYKKNGVALNSNIQRAYVKPIFQGGNNAYRLSGGEFSHLNAIKSAQRRYTFKGNVPLIDEQFNNTDLGVTTWTNDEFILPSGGSLLLNIPIQITQAADGSRTGNARAIRYEIQVTLKCGTYYHKRTAYTVPGLTSGFNLGDGDSIQMVVPYTNAKSWDTTSTNRTEAFTSAIDAEFGDLENYLFQIVTEAIPGDGAGIEIELDLVAIEADGDTDSTIAADALADATVTGSIELYVGDGQSSSGDEIIFSSSTDNNAREIFELEDALLGDQISDVATRGAIRYLGGAYTEQDWINDIDTTELNVNELLVREHLALRKYPVKLLRHTLYSPRIHFDEVMTYDGDTYCFMSMKFVANRCEYEAELFRVQRSSTGITGTIGETTGGTGPGFSPGQLDQGNNTTEQQIAGVNLRVAEVAPEDADGSLFVRSTAGAEYGKTFSDSETLTANVDLPLPKANGNTEYIAGVLVGLDRFESELYENGEDYIINGNDETLVASSQIGPVAAHYGYILPVNTETIIVKGQAFTMTSGLTFEMKVLSGDRPSGASANIALTNRGSVSQSPTIATMVDFDKTITGLNLSAGSLVFISFKKTGGTDINDRVFGSVSIFAT